MQLEPSWGEDVSKHWLVWSGEEFTFDRIWTFWPLDSLNHCCHGSDQYKAKVATWKKVQSLLPLFSAMSQCRLRVTPHKRFSKTLQTWRLWLTNLISRYQESIVSSNLTCGWVIVLRFTPAMSSLAQKPLIFTWLVGVNKPHQKAEHLERSRSNTSYLSMFSSSLAKKNLQEKSKMKKISIHLLKLRPPLKRTLYMFWPHNQLHQIPNFSWVFIADSTLLVRWTTNEWYNRIAKPPSCAPARCWECISTRTPGRSRCGTPRLLIKNQKVKPFIQLWQLCKTGTNINVTLLLLGMSVLKVKNVSWFLSCQYVLTSSIPRLSVHGKSQLKGAKLNHQWTSRL